MTTITLSAPHGQTTQVEAMASTEAKNGFAQLLARVTGNRGPVVITRNARPAAVMLSVEEYERLVQATPDPLASLQARFDTLVGTMQTPAGIQAVDALFAATPAQLGDAAAKAASKGKR
jgi:antitoxin Phd